MPKKEKKEKQKETFISQNCLIYVMNWKIIHKTKKKEYNHLFMSREIKFRWIFKNSWVFVFWYYFYSELENKHYIIWESNDYWFQKVETSIETLSQYTGFKDKNWNEIYEGDILYDDMNNKFAEVKMNSFWRWSLYWINWERMNPYYWESFFSWVDIENHLEIIWNIYETPNLINNK